MSVRKMKKPSADGRVGGGKTYKHVLIAMAVIFGIYAFTLLFPFVWLLINSLKTKFDFFDNGSLALPQKYTLENYSEVFSVFPMAEMFFNSVLLSTLIPTASVLFGTFTAYALAMFEFPGKRTVFWINIVVMSVNIQGRDAAMVQLYTQWKLMDTLFGMLFKYTMSFGFGTLFSMAMFKTVSGAYREAALIDGASEFTILFRIFIPVVLPLLMANWALSFIGNWNDFAGPYIFYSSHQTIATGIKYISDNIGTGIYQLDYPKLYAAMLIAVVPVIAVYAAFQKPILNRHLGGGVKG